MADNVFLLGAGFSHAAGIPLMSAFVERVWELAARRSYNGARLSPADAEVFSKAMSVWGELDGFHGRAQFDDRNIEDVLSMLSFNMLAGERGSTKKLDDINRAILRTIELACTVTHPGVPGAQFKVVETGPEEYRSLWIKLLKLAAEGHSFPTIITTNYDLVLERSLFQVLNSTRIRADNASPPDLVKLGFAYGAVSDPLYKVDRVVYEHWDGGDSPRSVAGTKIQEVDSPSSPALEINILKLHGSLSFPRRKQEEKGRRFSPTAAQEDPLILPPISHKLTSSNTESIWRVALQHLRTAKNVVVVGYSLPRTDVYMQYFLKAALGPNRDLSKITFFDPAFFVESPESTEMEKRYRDCFSLQMQKRLCFRPKHASEGTLSDFVELVGYAPAGILF